MNSYDIKINKFGDKIYYLNGLIHRKDGPAVVLFYGKKEWWINGKIHREDGPAIECGTFNNSWYLNDKCYGLNNDFTNESWKRFVKTLIFY